MDIVYFGSADFGVPALERVLRDGHRVRGVVTTPDRPRGRGLKVQPSVVARFAQEQGLEPVLKPQDLSDRAFLEQLVAIPADLFLVIAYRILPEAVFGMPPKGTINLHASLLPAYRGPAPIQRAIEDGADTTGVTVFRIDAGVDTGGILLQKSLAVGADETTPELYDRLSALGADAVGEALAELAAGGLSPRPQDDSAFSRAPKLKKSEARIDWHEDARTIRNRVRAFKPFPGTWTLLKSRRLGVEWCELHDRVSDSAAGTVLSAGGEGLVVQCGQGALRITAVKPEGRRRMDAADFLRGTTVTEGTVLG